jgi:DtxR family Mn-dependent transcriptional regulator
MNSEFVENYLKAIFELQAEGGTVKTSRLAGKLGVTAGSVTEMLKRLARTQPHLIDYRHHQGARLTAEGKKAALGVVRRHRLLETFLHEVLGLSWDEVHREAEKLEHHLSERVTDALEKFLNYPDYDPHGEPIPDRNRRLPASSHRKLTDVDVGQTACIVRVQPHQKELLPYLDELGIGIGTTALVTAKAPMDGPISVRIGKGRQQREHALGRGVTDHLFVEVRDVV